MRLCVVGGGIAGSLLAWRLAQRRSLVVTLVADDAGHNATNATNASGGLVRGYEPDDYNARLATASLTEMYASPVLMEWAQFNPVGSLYVTQSPPRRSALEELAAAVPDSVSLRRPDELVELFGVAGVPDGCTGVVERRAGYIVPSRFARMARQDLLRHGGQVLTGAVQRLRPQADGGMGLQVRGHHLVADLVVLATGAWTGRLLAANGLPPQPLRTKLIQYAVYAATGIPPPAFVDESSGLYGRPTGAGLVLLGLPTSDWDVDANEPRFASAGEEAVRRCAAQRLPGLSIAAAVRRVAAADGYAPDGRLALRPVLGDATRLFTFTGGSGGAAKTALAASATAVAELLDGGAPGHPVLTTIPKGATS